MEHAPETHCHEFVDHKHISIVRLKQVQRCARHTSTETAGQELTYPTKSSLAHRKHRRLSPVISACSAEGSNRCCRQVCSHIGSLHRLTQRKHSKPSSCAQPPLGDAAAKPRQGCCAVVALAAAAIVPSRVWASAAGLWLRRHGARCKGAAATGAAAAAWTALRRGPAIGAPCAHARDGHQQSRTRLNLAPHVLQAAQARPAPQHGAHC